MSLEDYCECYKMLAWKTALEAESYPVFIHPVKLKPYFCGRCLKDFSPDDHIFVGSLLHFDERKVICHRPFITKRFLTASIHGKTGRRNPNVRSSKKKGHICKTCHKSFSKEIYLIYHSRVHTKEKSYFCNECHKSFSHKYGLSYHKCHHKKDKTYSCQACGKRFHYENSLILHSRFHSEKKPYSCSKCSKKFSLKSNLSAHHRVHAN
nr:gastrula zinc finger protein XlCGF49.1 [Parasteatoda tepidariorum]XP_015905401.1 gastrula zinc finger protein XlCGF49.1 [Parasteatoda tepidariorum]XP_042901840.1 gastrula zinc finger protein XlCGF49.1 [Parasteatoda tepidariorum]XP_042901841.1 gastrula zinc finger protein XlCGF49.1 [Parasteatoda tepidariorum]